MIGGKNWFNVFVSEPNVGIQKLVQGIVFVRGVLQADMTTFLRVLGKLRHGNQTDSMIRVIVVTQAALTWIGAFLPSGLEV